MRGVSDFWRALNVNFFTGADPIDAYVYFCMGEKFDEIFFCIDPFFPFVLIRFFYPKIHIGII